MTFFACNEAAGNEAETGLLTPLDHFTLFFLFSYTIEVDGLEITLDCSTHLEAATVNLQITTRYREKDKKKNTDDDN
jgi:hypothetical protein